MARKRQRRSAFVPRILVPAATAVAVVPACAISSCSNGGSGYTYLGVASTSYGVAAVAYPAYEAGMPDTGPDATDAEPPEAGAG